MDSKCIRVVASCQSLHHSSNEVIPTVAETFVVFAPSVRDENVLCTRPQLADKSLHLFTRNRMENVRGSLAVIDVERFALVQTA